MSVMRSLYQRVEHLAHEVAKFGTVGAVAFVIDVGLFNLLTSGSGPLHHHNRVITANIVSISIAATFAYFANRHWTWKHRSRSGLVREYALFFGFNLVGIGIASACLAISHYGLHETSRLADNISAKGVGLIFSSLFRFWAYRRWVFLEPDEQLRSEEAASAAIV